MTDKTDEPKIAEIQAEFERYISQFEKTDKFWHSLNEIQKFVLVLNFRNFFASSAASGDEAKGILEIIQNEIDRYPTNQEVTNLSEVADSMARATLEDLKRKIEDSVSRPLPSPYVEQK